MKDYKKKFLVTVEVQQERMDICKTCSYRKGPVCMSCGCVLHLKTQLKKSTCPQGKW